MSRPRLEDRQTGAKCSRPGCSHRVPYDRDLYCSDRCMHLMAGRAWRERQRKASPVAKDAPGIDPGEEAAGE